MLSPEERDPEYGRLRTFCSSPLASTADGVDALATDLGESNLDGVIRLCEHADGKHIRDYYIDLGTGKVSAKRNQGAASVALVRVERDELMKVLRGACSPLDCLARGTLTYAGDELLLVQVFRALARDEPAIFEPCKQ